MPHSDVPMARGIHKVRAYLQQGVFRSVGLAAAAIAAEPKDDKAAHGGSGDPLMTHRDVTRCHTSGRTRAPASLSNSSSLMTSVRSANASAGQVRAKNQAEEAA